MKILASERGDTGKAAIDPWSAVAFGSGLAVGLHDLTVTQVILIAAVSKMASTAIIDSCEDKETIENKAFDAIAFIVGWKLGQIWNNT